MYSSPEPINQEGYQSTWKEDSPPKMPKFDFSVDASEDGSKVDSTMDDALQSPRISSARNR